MLRGAQPVATNARNSSVVGRLRLGLVFCYIAIVDEVMTRNPKTIGRDVMAGEALEILNSSKITTLIVTDGSKPVGIVHLHDFLRAGVA